MSWFPAGLVGVAIPRRLRGRLAILVHGSELAARSGSFRKLLMHAVFKRADRIIANSRFTAKRVGECGLKGSVSIVPCGVDATKLSRTPAHVPTILFIGRLVARKGCDHLIDALPRVRRKLGDVRLEIIGNGPDKERLAALAAHLDVQQCVEFLGNVPDEQRSEALSRAWCFAMPARDEHGDVEGFGIVYLEAAMAGLPAIGGKGSGAEDAIVDGITGFLVDPNDQMAITDALIDLLSEPERARAMGDAGRERALSHYTWRHNAIAIAREIGLPAP